MVIVSTCSERFTILTYNTLVVKNYKILQEPFNNMNLSNTSNISPFDHYLRKNLSNSRASSFEDRALDVAYNGAQEPIWDEAEIALFRGPFKVY